MPWPPWVIASTFLDEGMLACALAERVNVVLTQPLYRSLVDTGQGTHPGGARRPQPARQVVTRREL